MTLLWRKVLECSSSPCSLRHPCVLTHFVIPVISLIWRKYLECSSSHYSLRHPCVLTPMTCLLTHLIVIPDFSLESSHPSHPWLLTPITRVTTHSILSVLTHTHSHRTNPSHLTLSLPSLVLPCSLIPACSHITPTTTHSHWVFSHRVFSHPSSSLTTHSHHLCYHAHSSPRSLSPHFSECSHPSLVFSHSPSHIECHHTHSHILLTCVTTLSDLTSLVFWESVCSHFYGVVLPPSVLSHCLLSHTLSHSCHPCEHSHGVVLPPSLLTHCSERTCAPTHTPMVSYYHQVYPLTALRELVLPLTLPWCRTTTKSTHSLSHCLLSHTHSHGVVLPPSHHTPTPILVLPLTPMSSHTLLPSLHFTSFSPPTHPNSSPTLSHPSCLHHIIITSSPLPITNHHQSLPLTPYNSFHPFLSLPTLPIVS